MAGSWETSSLPTRPGLYANFVEAADNQTVGGARGTVAIPLKNFSGTSTEKTIYTVENENQANELFGSDNIQSIKLALQGGARNVEVYTLPTIDGSTVTEADAYAEAFNKFDTRTFDVFVFDGGVEDATQDSALTWVQSSRDLGKHFSVVFGGDSAADEDPTVGEARTTRLEDEYSVNLITGGEVTETSYASEDYAPYQAGLISGKRINESITYDSVPLNDVTPRLRAPEITSALQNGSLLMVHDGEKVKVEQGIATTGESIRQIRTRQAILTDLKRIVQDNYIGKVTNDADGRATLQTGIQAYLERLANENAIQLDNDSVVVDPQHESGGNAVYLRISYTEVDSMERVFLTINI